MTGTKANTKNQDYSTALNEHVANNELDKTVGSPDAVFATDAANDALNRFDPQSHDEAIIPVLTPANPNLDKATPEQIRANGG